MQFDVAIIGYGPVAALAALSLADAGLQVLILERSTEPTDLPRAAGLDGETLHAFQRLGLGDEVSELCQPPRESNEIHFTNSRHEKIFGSDISSIGPNGWRDAHLPLATMQICDPARLASYICVKDPNRRWEFQLQEGESREEMQSPAKIRELLEPWTAPENYEIKRSAVYQFHAATARAWQVGRIFLAGDAAHLTSPFLGQGLNARFRDAVNLGWKIPLVLAHMCDESLLESYSVERDPHARELVDRAVSVGKLTETLAARETGLPDPHPPESINIDIAGPIVPPMRKGYFVQEQSSGEQRVGGLLHQPTVRDDDGVVRRLDQFLGGGFCLVGRKSADLALGSKASAVFERLGGRIVALEGLQLVEGQPDPVFDTHPAVALRPNRYGFGVVDEEWSLHRLVIDLGWQLRVLA